jgi:outer membrane protein OmpA-like peptidoglycan-associated protein
MIIFIFAGIGNADTVRLRNGDQLGGKIQNQYLVMQSSFGQIVVQKDFYKSLTMDSKDLLTGSVQTINNDHLNGTVLNREIQIERADGNIVTIDMKLIEALYVNFSGPSHQALTTIFTMTDGSRISGKLINPEIEVHTDYMTATHKADEINRIDFAAAAGGARLLLSSGDIIEGRLSPDQLVIKPDSFLQIEVDQTHIRSIQFNSRKMLVKEFSDITAAETAAISGLRETSAPDEDHDGISDLSDKCPQTPTGAEVDQKGCWILQTILFDFDSYKIKPQYFPELDKVSATLKKNPTIKIEIRGSTDNIGSTPHNQTLSENRARAVKNYLMQSGIDDERLLPVGYGSKRKVASNESPEGRALNRRVDFFVMK